MALLPLTDNLYDQQSEQATTRLAIKWLAVLMVVAFVMVVVELYLVDRLVSSTVTDMFNQIMASSPRATAP